MEPEELEVITFRDLFEFIRKGLLLALAVGIAAGAAAYFLSKQVEPTYRARASLLASQPGDAGNFGVSLVTAPPVDVSAYRAAASSGPVLVSALAQLGITSPTPEQVDEFSDSINVRTETTNVSSLVHIEVEDEDRVLAAQQAQAVAEALLEWDTSRATRNLENIVTTLETQIAALDMQIGEARALGGDALEQLEALQSMRADYNMQLGSARALRNSAVGRLEILEPAQPPISPVAPRPLLSAALAAVLGVFLTYGLLLLRDALDTRLRGTDDLARVTNLPVLAEFPQQTGMRRLPREASSYLRTNLLFLSADTHPKIILVTSDQSSQGKSSVALSLAESFARNEHRTLLVDADLRKPVLGNEFNLDPLKHDTLRTFLENPHQPAQPASVQIDKGVVLDIVPSFQPAPDPTELLSRSFKNFLQQQAEEYDVIIVDSAPILPVADTLTIAPHATGTVMAVSMGDSDQRSIKAALELLQRLGVRVFGTVATNVEYAKRGSAEGYGYGYGYGPRERAGTRTETARQSAATR